MWEQNIYELHSSYKNKIQPVFENNCGNSKQFK